MHHHIETKIQKWGNGLGLRVSGVLRDIPHFSADTPVSVEVFEDGFIVKKIIPANKRPRFDEQTLLADMTSLNAHTDLLTEPLASEQW